MSRRPPYRLFRPLATLLACGALIATVLFSAPSASAITDTSATTTLSDSATGATGVAYTFGPYSVANNQTALGATITFDAGTDVSGATVVSPGGTCTVSGQTVTVTFDTYIRRNSSFSIVIGGIANPASGGTHPAGTLTITTGNPKGGYRGTETVARGAYTITGPQLTLSVSTNTVDFGNVDPGTTPPPATITVDVTATSDYSITRQITGDASILHLAVTGDADGTKTAGTASYTDAVTISPGWDAPPETPLAASIVYTAVMP